MPGELLCAAEVYRSVSVWYKYKGPVDGWPHFQDSKALIIIISPSIEQHSTRGHNPLHIQPEMGSYPCLLLTLLWVPVAALVSVNSRPKYAESFTLNHNSLNSGP